MGEFVHLEDSLFWRAFHHAPIGMGLVSMDGRWLKVNPSLCKITGYSEEEFLQSTFQDITHPDDLQESLLQMKHLTEKKVENYQMDKRYFHKEGHVLWISLSVSRVDHPDGNPLFVIAQIQDISARKWEEISRNQILNENLKHSQESFMVLIDKLPEAAIVLSQDICIYANSVAYSLLESVMEDMLGASILQFVRADFHDMLKERLARLYQGERNRPAEYWMVTRKQEEREAVLFSFPVFFDGKQAILVILQDVTERNKAQQLLAESEKLSTLGLLAAGIAHEIRNPLTALKGFLKLMSSHPVKQDHLSIMESELNRIEAIVNELLFLSKPKNHSISFFDMRELVEEVISFLEPHALLNKATLLFSPKPRAARINGDRNQLKQVFINLIKNAIEATHPGKTIRIDGVVKNGEIRMSVKDEGDGIAPEILEKLGQPFISTKEKGTGLGLMVCYNIIGNHGGRIDVRSNFGRGTIVTVCLPAYPVESVVL